MKGIHYTNDWVMCVSGCKKYNTLFHSWKDSVLDKFFSTPAWLYNSNTIDQTLLDYLGGNRPIDRE